MKSLSQTYDIFYDVLRIRKRENILVLKAHHLQAQNHLTFARNFYFRFANYSFLTIRALVFAAIF